MLETYKTYNLKLDKETYFKLREIELDFEKINNSNLTKSEIISIVIKAYKKQPVTKNQVSILD
jgi:hypothetical protein